VRRLCHVVITLAGALTAAHAQQPDATELIRQSIQNYDKAWRSGMRWSYTQTDVTYVDGKKEVDIASIMPLEGTPYERLISKNGHALSADEQRKEDEKYDRELRRRQNESAAERQARIKKYEKERSFLTDVPKAYNFKLAGEDLVDGRSTWVVELSPRAGFVPTTPHAGLLKHIAGKLWIDKKELQWAKAEADVIDSVSIGLILARIGPGAHIVLDFARVSDSLWVPKQIVIKGEARILLVHNKNLDERLTFSNYHLPDRSAGPEVADSDGHQPGSLSRIPDHDRR
jgi:hypothetical protein